MGACSAVSVIESQGMVVVPGAKLQPHWPWREGPLALLWSGSEGRGEGGAGVGVYLYII